MDQNGGFKMKHILKYNETYSYSNLGVWDVFSDIKPYNSDGEIYYFGFDKKLNKVLEKYFI